MGKKAYLKPKKNPKYKATSTDPLPKIKLKKKPQSLLPHLFSIKCKATSSWLSLHYSMSE